MGFGMSECLFIFGMGYSGLLLANEMIARGWTVSGTCREENKRKLLENMGIKAYLFHKNHPLSLAQQVLADTTHLISTIPPDTNGDPVLGLHAKNLSDLPNVKWAGYISTTGVYGDRGGDWVDEDTVAEPTGERGKLRVLAEEKWFSLLSSGLPIHVFRTAGIYGPERNPFTKLRSGTATRVDKPGHVFSRIHVNDLINIIRDNIKLLREIDLNIKIDFNTKKNKILFNCDSEQISRVFFNLIKNSIESIQEKANKSKDFNKKIDIEINKINDYINIIIIDNGLGFASQNTKDIIKPYYTTKKI